MSEDQQISKIGVTFGDQFDTNGHMNAKISLVVNSKNATEKMKEATEKTGNHFETLNYSLLLTFENCSDVSQLKKLFDLLQSDESKLDDDKGKPLNEQKLFKVARKLLKEVNFNVHHDEKNVYLQITMKEKISEKVLEPFQVLLESGLKDLAEKTNSIEADLCLNLNSEQMIEKFKQKNRLLATLLSQLRANITLKLDKNFSNSLEEVISNIDEGLLKSPQIQILKYFKNVEVNLAFNSADNLPEPIRQFVLPGKPQEETKVNFADETLLSGFLEYIPANVTAEFFIDEVAYLNASVCAPGLQKILTDYFSYVFKRVAKE